MSDTPYHCGVEKIVELRRRGGEVSNMSSLWRESCQLVKFRRLNTSRVARSFDVPRSTQNRKECGWKLVGRIQNKTNFSIRNEQIIAIVGMVSLDR